MSTPTAAAVGGSIAEIAVESSGKYLYMTSGGDTGNIVAQYNIDQTTGVLTPMSNPTVTTNVFGPSQIVTVGK
jgi:6-phosphogluconolactonase (cycloisomerase 2 family)